MIYTLKDFTNWEDMKNKVIMADCLEAMKLIPDKSIDLILTDPPYFEVKGAFDFIWDSFEDYLKFVETCAIEFKRILKDNGSLFWFGHAKKIAYSQIIFDKHFSLENNLVWDKGSFMGLEKSRELNSFAPCTERILFYSNETEMTGRDFVENEFIAPRNPFAKELKRARMASGLTVNKVAELGGFYGNVNHGGSVTNWEKGYSVPSPEQWELIKSFLPLEREYEDLRRPFNNQSSLQEVLRHKNFQAQNAKIDHDTVKPIPLISNLLETTTRDKALVLDPFMGSWTTARACKDLGRDFIGFELEEDYCKVGEERLRQENLF